MLTQTKQKTLREKRKPNSATNSTFYGSGDIFILFIFQMFDAGLTLREMLFVRQNQNELCSYDNIRRSPSLRILLNLLNSVNLSTEANCCCDFCIDYFTYLNFYSLVIKFIV